MNMDTQVRIHARKDCQKLLKSLSRISSSSSPQCKMLEVHPSKYGYTVQCRLSLKDKHGCKVTSVTWEYRNKNNFITSSFNVNSLLNSITGSSNSRGRRIYAADEDLDEFDEFDEDFDDVEDEETEDDLEDESDSDEDDSSWDDDIDVDETKIPTDNNIDNHYIVECDNCHGIFISALVESDQLIRNIRGICPLCDKESDQYINWIVRKVDNEEFEEEENFEEFFEIP